VADPIAVVDDDDDPRADRAASTKAKAAVIERLLGHPRAEGDDV